MIRLCLLGWKSCIRKGTTDFHSFYLFIYSISTDFGKCFFALSPFISGKWGNNFLFNLLDVSVSFCFFYRLALKPRPSKTEKKQPLFYTNSRAPKSQAAQNGAMTIFITDIMKTQENENYEELRMNYRS